MSHLPECPHSNSRTATFYGGYCVCPLLRDCEQRTEEAWSAIAGRDQYAEGYRAALNAVRETVAGIPPGRYSIVDALAAIDALREKP